MANPTPTGGMTPLDWVSAGSQAAGGIGEILGLLGVGRKRQIRDTKDMMNYQAELEYDWNQKAADQDYLRQLDMYNRQIARADYENEYNSASSQVKRLNAAGMLGASLFSSAAPGTPSVDVGASGVNPSGRSSVGYPGENITGPSSFDKFYQSAMGLAQLDNLRANTELQRSQAGKEDALASFTRVNEQSALVEIVGKKEANQITKLNRKLFEATFDNKVAISDTELNTAIQQMFKTTSDAAITEYYRKNVQPIELQALNQSMQLQASQIGVNYALSILHQSQASLTNTQVQYMQEMITSAIADNQMRFIQLENAKTDQRFTYGDISNYVEFKSTSNGKFEVVAKDVKVVDPRTGQEHVIIPSEVLRNMIMQNERLMSDTGRAMRWVNAVVDPLCNVVSAGASVAFGVGMLGGKPLAASISGRPIGF